MATKKVDTTPKAETVASENNIAAVERKERLSAADHYRAQEKVEISISPLYRPYFGNVMEIIINGVYCALPVDGRTYKLAQTFANEAARRIAAVDAQNKRSERLADVQNNHENFIGELQLI